jgi:hypothetical protein
MFPWMSSMIRLSVISRSIAVGASPSMIACSITSTKLRWRSWIGDTLTATRGALRPCSAQAR